MKLQSYEPQVRQSQPSAPQIIASNDTNAYGGNVSGLQDMAKAVNQWSVEIEKQIENEDRTAILKAMDVYNNGRYDIMYNEKDGLMNTKGEGASGISQAYRDKTNMLRSHVLDTFKIQKKANLDGLINSMNTSAQQGFVAVNRHQYQEGERVKDAALNNNLSSIASMLQKDYNSPNAVNDALLNARLAVSLRYGDAGKDIIEAANKNADSQIVGATISGAIAQSDFNNAAIMLRQYGDMLSPQQKVQFTNTLQQKGSQEHLYSIGKTAYELFGDNEQAALEWMSKQPGFSVSSDSNNRAMDAAENQQAQNNYFNEVNTNKRIERDFIDSSTMQFGEELYKMFNDGKNYDTAVTFARERAGNNIKLMKAYNSVVKSYYGENGGAANKLTVANKKFCERLLSEGRFSNATDYVKQIASMGGGASEQYLAMREWQEWKNGTGKFRYSSDQLLKMATGDRYDKLKKDDKIVLGAALHDTVGAMIADYQAKNHKDPTELEVIEMSKKAITSAPVPGLNDSYLVFNWNTESSPAALRMAGITDVVEKGENANEITLDDGTKRLVTDAELRAMIRGGNNWFSKIDDSNWFSKLRN